MWLFHPLGFCSIVAHAGDPHSLLARGRISGDLERLFPGFKIQATPRRDYRYRTVVPRGAVARRVAEMVVAIDYPNFKDAAPRDRHDAYLNVWTTMYYEQVRRAPKARRRRQPLGLAPTQWR